MMCLRLLNLRKLEIAKVVALMQCELSSAGQSTALWNGRGAFVEP